VCNTVSVASRLDWPQHNSVAVVGADNMHYLTYVALPSMNQQNNIKYTNFYNTINIWQQYLPVNLITLYEEESRSIFPEIDATNEVQIRQSLLLTSVAHSAHIDKSWQHCSTHVQQHHSLEEYPPLTNHVEPPRIEIHTLLHNINTAAFKDVDKLLSWIFHQIIAAQKYMLVILFGDKQLIIRC
jgi:hypothetical protein